VARIIHLGASSARKPSTVSLRHERRPHSSTPRRRSTRFDGDGRKRRRRLPRATSAPPPQR